MEAVDCERDIELVPISAYHDLLAAEYAAGGHSVERAIRHPNGITAIAVHDLKLIVQARRYSTYSRKVGRGQAIEYGEMFDGYSVRLHFLVDSQSDLVALKLIIPSLEVEGVRVTWQWSLEGSPVIYRAGSLTWGSLDAVRRALEFTIKNWGVAREQDKETLLEVLNFPHRYSLGAAPPPRYARIEYQESGNKCFAVRADISSSVLITLDFLGQAINDFDRWTRIIKLQPQFLGQQMRGESS